MAENCNELPMPTTNSSAAHSHKGVCAEGMAKHIIRQPSRRVLATSTRR